MNELASKGQLRASYFRWAVVLVPLVVLLGFASASLTPSGAENPWFQGLAKPSLNPPPIVFPIVWTALYVLMGLALALIVDARRAEGRGVAIALFFSQLAANLAWSPVFFGAHRIALALGLIGVILGLAIATTFAFAPIRRAAAWLMLPYLVWLGFAGVLNWRFLELNPDAAQVAPAASTTQIQL